MYLVIIYYVQNTTLKKKQIIYIQNKKFKKKQLKPVKK